MVGKMIQKQSFDILSRRYGLLVVLVGMFLVMYAAFQFGETIALWSTEKYAAVFNSFSDNIAGRSFRQRLCLPLPIDIVYTWVNGSDPQLISDLRTHRRILMHQTEVTETGTISSKCNFESCVAAYGVVLEPSLPPTISLERFVVLYPSFEDATHMHHMEDPVTGRQVTALLFSKKESAEAVVSERVVISEQVASVRRLFFTTDQFIRNAVATDDTLLMTGFPDKLGKEELLSAIPAEQRKDIPHFVLHEDRGVAVLKITNHTTMNFLLTATNISISGKSPTFSKAHFVWDLTD